MFRKLPCPPVVPLLVAIAALLVGAMPASAGSCAGPLTVLVDRSASMAEHDPLGSLRLSVAEALQRWRPARDGDLVRPFDARLGAPVAAQAGGWPSALGAALAGGDRGATSLADVLGELPSSRAGVVVITDQEASLGSTALGEGSAPLIVVVGGRASDALRVEVRAAGGRVIEVRSPAEAARAAWCEEPERSPAPAPLDVVLVSGLRSTAGQVLGATTPARCQAAASLAGWCRALVAQGLRVWVPAARPRGAGGAVVDSTGALARNASALTAWWARTGRRRSPVLVGHSMGGLIAHAALRRGMAARALITVGTPHAGSYGADAYFAALAVARGCSLSCPATAAQLLAAAVVLRRRFGAALGDLTREQRTRSAPLGRVAVPLATWAGATTRLPGLPSGAGGGAAPRDGYVSPNDGIVGVGSATGALAGLQPALSVSDGDARHSSSVPPAGRPTQLGSGRVERWLTETAHALGAGADPAGARIGAAQPMRRSALAGTARPPARQARVRLRPLAKIATGAVASIDPGSVVVATAPIGVWCDDAPAPLVQLGAALWFIDLGAAGCQRATTRPTMSIAPAGSGWVLGAPAPGAPAAAEHLTATRRRDGRWLVQLRLAAPGRIALWRGSARVRLQPARPGREWHDPLAWRAVLGTAGPADLTVRVRAGNAPPRVASLQLP